MYRNKSDSARVKTQTCVHVCCLVQPIDRHKKRICLQVTSNTLLCHAWLALYGVRNVYCHVVLNSSGFTVQKLPKLPLANLNALNWRDLAETRFLVSGK